MSRWVEDLNSEQFTVRKSATAKLEQFATGHTNLLQKAHQQASSLEIRQRLDQILHRLDPERLRLIRMLEVLERQGTAQARQFLQRLVEQKQDSELARDAAASLKRLEHRGDEPPLSK